MYRYEEKSPVLLNHASTCGMVDGIFRLSPEPSPLRHCTKHYCHDSTPSRIAYQHEIVCSQTIFFVSFLAMSQPTIWSNVCSPLYKKLLAELPAARCTSNYRNEDITTNNFPLFLIKQLFPREGKEISPLHF